jgi:glutamyl-tRNA synthetase
MLSRTIVDSLFPPDLPEPEHWERRYPPRDLPEGAQVTRFSPSPTGFLHIGGVYAATIDVDVARHSGGVYLVRLEDTDQARVAEGAAAQFADAFAYFSIGPDEDDRDGHYGPYSQSLRAQTYLTYVRELLRQDKAYLDFATKQDLEEITARQRAAGALPGYYGKWALWRDADPALVTERLAAGDPYVVRFRSPAAAGARVSFTDAIRGELTLDANRNDAVVLKSSDTEPRLPTYHLAHAVDDHLMRVTLVIRGEEWISSVPLHLQLFDALGFPRVQYAHIALLMKQEGGSRRKLSKRRDPEATVSFYIEQGYPAPAVQYYLRGLANGRLAEMPLPEALATPIRLSECGTAGPLVDMVKLDDICADYVATLPGEQILGEVTAWARRYDPKDPEDPEDPDLAAALETERERALRALSIERDGVANPRKDLRKWADFRAVYGYFFPALFDLVTDPADERFAGLDPDLVRAVANAFADGYQPPTADTDWFDQIRLLAAALGFAPSQKVYKQDPAAYRGSIREASQVIRVLLTGTPRSPDLAAVAAALGPEEVLRRVRALGTAGISGE